MPTERASTIRRRISAGLAVSASGPIVTSIMQIVSVPIFLQLWGAEKYGEWLLLWAIPGYLSISDIGFGDASGSDMTMRVAEGDRAGALITFQSSWATLCVLSIAFFLAAAILIGVIPIHSLFKMSSISDSDCRWALLAIAGYILLTQQNGVFESGFRCEGRFAQGALGNLVLRVAETLSAVSVGVITGSILLMSVTYCGIRLLGTVAYATAMLRQTPWLRLGLEHADLRAVKQLIRPGCGFTILPLGQALASQGIPMIIGAAQGSVAVAVFTSTRTLTRAILQLASALSRTVWPELSTAFGRSDLVLARKLYTRALCGVIIVSVPGALALGLAGPEVFRQWTHNRLHLDAGLFYLLLSASVANSIWYMNSVVVMAQNAHEKLSIEMIITTVMFLGFCVFAEPKFGLAAAGITILGIDLLMCLATTRYALRYLSPGRKATLRSSFLLVVRRVQAATQAR